MGIYKSTMLQASAYLLLAQPALAVPQWWNGYGNNGGGGRFGSGGFGNGNGNGNGNDNGNGNGNNGFGINGFGRDGSDFDINRAMYLAFVHGVLAAVAFVLLFPIGSILMRVIPGRFAIVFHALTQVIALATFIAAAGLGIYLAQSIHFPFQNGTLLNDSSVNFHPIIGLVVLGMVAVQPVLGYLHHAAFKRLGRRQAWSYLHMWNGRIAITLGIINGGLGLMIARESERLKTAYAIVSAIMWVAWLAAAILAEHRRAMAARKESRQNRRESRRRERAHKSSSRSASS